MTRRGMRKPKCTSQIVYDTRSQKYYVRVTDGKTLMQANEGFDTQLEAEAWFNDWLDRHGFDRGEQVPVKAQ